MDLDPRQLAYAALAWPILLFSLCFHEFGHAISAKWFGDETAEHEGRLTMNPLSHIDPIGTVVFPLVAMLNLFGLGGFIFGWAKPVPVNHLRLRRMQDIIWVSLAGPGCNLILAVLGSLAFLIYVNTGHAYDYRAWGMASGDVIQNFLGIFISLNLLLMIFNLIPLTPLDGSRVVLAKVPGHSRMMPFWRAYEQNGFIILLLLLITGGLFYIVGVPMQWIILQLDRILSL